MKLLDQCDLRGAHQAFVDAYGMDSNDPAIALAFALSDVVLLPEDPALETLRPRFGFTKPFDTTFLWSQGGFMDQASKKTLTCDALGDLVRASLPNPALDKTSPTPFADVLDKTLTFGDMRDAGLALGPRFDKLSKAFETAANAASADGVDIKGGCGANELVLQKPELYVLAGAFALLEASFQLAKTYDGSVRLWPLVASNDATAAADLASDMNAAFLHVADASQAGSAQPLFLRAFGLFTTAATAALAVTKTPPNAVIDWRSFPGPILTEAKTLAQGAHDAFAGATAIPFLSPTVTVDGSTLFSSPIELAPLTPVAFTASGSSVTMTFDPMRDRIGGRMSPNPFTSNASYTWSFIDDISSASDAQPNWWTATFDPSSRFTSTYACQ